MIGRSAAFDSALVNSHQVVVACEVWSGPGGTKLATLQPADGDVTGDVANAVRRSMQATFTDPTGAIVPSTASDLLTPFGHELRMYRGLVIPATASTPQTVELLPLGVFGVTDVEIEQSGKGALTVKVQAYDRASRVARSRFRDLYTIAAGTNVGTAVLGIIQTVTPELTEFAFSPVTSTLPATVYRPGDDPWKACLDIAAAAGLDLYFDPYGRCVLAPIPDPATAPVVWTYNTGSQSLINRVNRKITSTGAYNDVLVIGSGLATATSGALLVEVADTNPNSPTYVNGPYGRNVTVFDSPLITTAQQAQYAGQGILARSIGLGETVEFEAIVHPAHEPGDVVQITHLPTKTSARHVLDGVHHPLHHSGRSTHRTRRRSA